MDEPTASLDSQAKKRIHELLRTLKSRGVTVLIITHDREEAEQIADRVVRMPIAAPRIRRPLSRPPSPSRPYPPTALRTQ